MMKYNVKIFSAFNEKLVGPNKLFKELKYSGSTYNMLFTHESNVSFLAVIDQQSIWTNNQLITQTISNSSSNALQLKIIKMVDKMHLKIVQIEATFNCKGEAQSHQVEFQIRNPDDKFFVQNFFFKKLIQKSMFF